MDITYIPMARALSISLWCSIGSAVGAVVVAVDHYAGWYSCVETLEDALARHGKPDIFNTDQGLQFTGSAFTGGARQQRHCDPA